MLPFTLTISLGVARPLKLNSRPPERLLPAFQFQRIHRSTMVRIDAVDRVKAGQFHSLIAVLNDGTELRVGRTYTAAIRARLARRG